VVFDGDYLVAYIEGGFRDKRGRSLFCVTQDIETYIRGNYYLRRVIKGMLKERIIQIWQSAPSDKSKYSRRMYSQLMKDPELDGYTDGNRLYQLWWKT
jgi:hypothetical protein